MISLIGGISVVGVALGVAALIIVLSVMNGFDKEVKEKIIGTYADIVIFSEGGIPDPADFTAGLSELPEVERAAPFITGQAILLINKSSTGILVKGIDPAKEKFVSSVIAYTGDPGEKLKEDTIILGSELMRNERIAEGDTVEVMIPYSAMDIKKKKLKVVGSFTSGRYDYDANIAVVDMALAQELFRMEGLATGVGINADVKDEKALADLKYRLGFDLGPGFVVKTWMDLDHNLVTALAVEKKMMFAILAIIVMVACFNVSGSLIMMVMEKTRDIGILKAIGANSRGVSLVFLMVGAIVGSIGILFGTALGIGVAENINYLSDLIEQATGVAVFPNDIYYFSKIPVCVDPNDIVTVVALALVLAIIAGVYPARKASRLDPVVAIRYE